MYLDYYKNKLVSIPDFMKKYLSVPSMERLKNVGYFCGMDYASKDIYDFAEYISRYDHSLTVSLMTYQLTNDKTSTLSALFHDIATPCFSHVIDYMNGDFLKQESTEEYTDKIITSDIKLCEYLKNDGLNLNDIINFKKYSVVDLDRPKLCSDRLDGIILNGIGWVKDISKDDIDMIIDSLGLYNNEDGELEIGFNNKKTTERVISINDKIDLLCHSVDDNYMMILLSEITKLALKYNLFNYEDLYYYNEDQMFNILNNCNVDEIDRLMNIFYNIKKSDIPEKKMPLVKKRHINPICCGRRYNNV